MDPASAVVPASEPLETALSRLAAARGRLLYVVSDGPLRAISLTRAKTLWAACMRGEGLPADANAGTIATPVPTIGPGDSLFEVGEKLWDVDWGELPVVDPSSPHLLLGVVSRRAVLGAFDRELLQRDVLTTRIVSSEGGHTSIDYVELPDGHRVAVVPAPAWLIGTAPDLSALRAEIGVILVAVRRDVGGDALPRWIDPEPGLTLEPSDQVLVIATESELDAFASRQPSPDA
jgi:CBS domain-containing protein